MDLVLRKRICINVYKRQSITDRLKKRMVKTVSECWYFTKHWSVMHYGVMYSYSPLCWLIDVRVHSVLASRYLCDDPFISAYRCSYISGTHSVDTSLNEFNHVVAIWKLWSSTMNPVLNLPTVSCCYLQPCVHVRNAEQYIVHHSVFVVSHTNWNLCCEQPCSLCFSVNSCLHETKIESFQYSCNWPFVWLIASDELIDLCYCCCCVACSCTSCSRRLARSPTLSSPTPRCRAAVYDVT